VGSKGPALAIPPLARSSPPKWSLSEGASKAWFGQLDRNGDGQISLHEWGENGWPLEEFERIDRNGDGFLSPQEVVAYWGRKSSHH
jgi:hypothetical protein